MIGDVKSKVRISGDVKAKASITGDINSKTVVGDVILGRVVVKKYESDPYEGIYKITPSAEEQIFATKDKHMIDDLTVNPIPYFDIANEYGRTIIIGGEINA